MSLYRSNLVEVWYFEYYTLEIGSEDYVFAVGIASKIDKIDK